MSTVVTPKSAGHHRQGFEKAEAANVTIVAHESELVVRDGVDPSTSGSSG